MATEPLSTYWAKRDFAQTPEPRGERQPNAAERAFVIQKHDATRLHYDFRLELDGVLLSWAVPKGPSFDPADKRMAIRTEDHPLSYASFEGTIPPKHYGAGTVIVWDHGTWEPVGDPQQALAAGKLAFTLHGQKLSGLWELVRIQSRDARQEAWILFKKRDAHVRLKADFDVTTALPDSVIAKPLAPAGGASAAAKQTAAVKRAKPTPAVDALPGAVKAALPETLSPQLATLVTALPAVGRWLCEMKLDGYRLLTRFERGKPQLLTRNGHDWTDKMPALAAELTASGIRTAWLDGEIVVMGAAGHPDFNALQNAFDRARTEAIVYYVFDMPFEGGRDLRQVPLEARRAALERLLAGKTSDRIRYSATFDAEPAQMLASACELGLEGVMAKRADAPYVGRRSDTWLKLKCDRRQEFVIAGYTVKSGTTAEVGSLVLGVYDVAGALVSVGSVGTGWNVETARALYAQLSALGTDASPFAAGAPKKGRWTTRAAGSERWVQPTLVAEVRFAEWTPAGQIRHASFIALRTDKPARQIVREQAVAPETVPASAAVVGAAAAPRKAVSLKITHGERVIDASTGRTKLDLIRYYESVADWILPHLKGRPVSLVRGPSGIGGQLFFQKHGEKIGIPGIKELDAALWPGHAALLEVPSVEALIGAAQMNVIEFHTWNSTVPKIDLSDRMIFDLDPGDGVSWPHMQEAAQLTRALLLELGLAAWLKTSGGKGLHVVVPLARKLTNDAVKSVSQAIVQHLAQTIPERFVAKSGPANRVGKIFVDYLRNGHGATTAVAYSARARPGLGVSMPIAWEQLADVKSGAEWTVANAREHLSFERSDPWAGYTSSRQTLAKAIKTLGLSLAVEQPKR